MPKLSSRDIANISVLTALSAGMLLLGIEYPFIYLPYLKIDISEIPILLVAIMFGPVSAFISSVIVGFIVAIRNPVGAVFKFAAIISNALPLALMVNLPKRTREKTHSYSAMLKMLWFVGFISILIRTFLMVVLNYIMIDIFAKLGMLGDITSVEEWAQIWGMSISLLLIITGIFNIIQGAINVSGAIIIVQKLPPEWVPEWLKRSD